ncbi:hypothetical protein N8I74_11280 [Chitiniphilus purpureus]|uniref:Uncharacterized protein n=1 Tax=Chitiniphilus purpureus TaxID=2981137 RepID=A0ABY6DHT0_9NEIS|nr:hypothetical protein [Chitiniphilus sp. CD1]UXY13904.1 hypothetical protein N8I74_11280 [Chitiniphilus sp. CD1]
MKLDLLPYLDYLAATLADRARVTPTPHGAGCSLGWVELARGVLDETTQAALRQAMAPAAPPAPWPVLVYPRLYLRDGANAGQRDAWLAPVVVHALLGADGTLHDDPQQALPCVLPRALSGLLRQTQPDNTHLATEAYARFCDTRGSWAALLRQAEGLLVSVADATWDDLELAGHRLLPQGYVQLCTALPATCHQQQLLALLRADPDQPLPLLARLLQPAGLREPLGTTQSLALSEHHLGQFSARAPLSPTQRMDLLHHLAGQAGETDVLGLCRGGADQAMLLQNAIANLWVEHALHHPHPPVIVLTADTVAALAPLLAIETGLTEQPFAGRWLAEPGSLGLQLVAHDEAAAPALSALHGVAGKARFAAQIYEETEGLAQARMHFLARASIALGERFDQVATVAERLQARLQHEAETIRQSMATLRILNGLLDDAPLTDTRIAAYLAQRAEELESCLARTATAGERSIRLQRIEQDWADHLATEPWWHKVLAAVGLDRWRQQRDTAFIAAARRQLDPDGSLPPTPGNRDALHGALHAQLLAAQAIQAEGQTQSAVLQAKLAQLRSMVDALQRLLPPGAALCADAVQAALDTGARHTAFQLALHYWEARYLEELAAQLRHQPQLKDTRGPEKLRRHYRRLAKLHPCFVATPEALPARFIGYLNQTDAQPLANFIDLLIVADAGHLAPERVAPAFALAKRALVLGEATTDPGWMQPHALDERNALNCGVATNAAQLATLHEAGLTAAAGTLLHLALRACPYAPAPEAARATAHAVI